VSSQPRQPQLKWPLRVTESQSDHVLVLEVAGRIGHAASAGFGDALAAASRRAGGLLVLDMAGVDYVSSSGLQVLGAAANSLTAGCGSLVLCCLSEPVRIAIELAGMLDALAIEPSRDEAASRIHRQRSPSFPSPPQ
jgi:anti-anti-sigma factor